jgi:cbb3-type cytochrome oxidase subunit 3
MKLSDVVSSLHLPLFAEVPLLVFFGVFLGVALHLLGKPEAFARAAALPLRDERRRQGGQS